MAQAICWSLACHASLDTPVCKAPLMPHMSTLLSLAQELEQPGGRHLQTVRLLDFGPPQSAHTLAQDFVVLECLDRLNPLCRTAGLKPVAAMINDLLIHTHWRANDWPGTGHILDQFETTLAPFPNRIPQGHDANVKLLQLSHLRILAPGFHLQGQAR
jgi:hypothetical protein